MNILEFEEKDCQNCYKCIRHCGVKAISYQDNQVSINQSDCILCGECVLVCPTHAKHLTNDFIYVKSLIEKNDHVVVSLAPSYQAYFPNVQFSYLSRALKALGFSEVQESVLGAALVNEAYRPYIDAKEKKHLITTSCYSTVLLVEKYFHSLVPYLLPVDSPMIAHAKMIKQQDSKAKVVFVGPCVSKKAEADNALHHGMIDAVLTFEDVVDWMEEIGVLMEDRDEEMVGIAQSSLRLYPKEHGVIDSLAIRNSHYQPISVSGLEECKALFQALVENDKLPSFFIEANVCRNSCLGGPVLRKAKVIAPLVSYLLTSESQEQDRTVPYSQTNLVDLRRVFYGNELLEEMPSEEEIQAILHRSGKFSDADEMNCGCCGYESCRKKAIAVYQKKADIDMCLPFFKQRAESLSNMIIEYSPNAIFVLDEEFQIQEINPSAEVLFHLEKKNTLHTCLPMFLREDIVVASREKNQTIREKLFFPEIERRCLVSATWLEEQHYYLVIIQDITQMEAQHAALIEMRVQTLDATTKVIEKQMRVAQEIASLLGETTAETKMTLTKLKRVIYDEGNHS